MKQVTGLGLLFAAILLCGCQTGESKNKILANTVWIEVNPAMDSASAEIFYSHAASYLNKKGFTLTPNNPEVLVKYDQLRETTVGDVARGAVMIGAGGGPIMALPARRGRAESYLGEEGVVNIFHKGTRLGGKYLNWQIELQGYSSKHDLLEEFPWYVCEPVWKAFTSK
jgi:hypothetical protein